MSGVEKAARPDDAAIEKEPASQPPIESAPSLENVPSVPPPLTEQLVYDRLLTEKQAGAETAQYMTAQEFRESTQPESTRLELTRPETAPKHDEIEKVGEALLDAADVEPQEETELERELRHERKDLSGQALAQSVGQVLENIHQQTIAAHQDFFKSTTAGDGAMPDMVASDQAASDQSDWLDKLKTMLSGIKLGDLPLLGSLPPLYQRAVISGLGGGLLVAAVWLVINLL